MREQNCNRKCYSKSGYKGVYSKGYGFKACTTVNKKMIYLGFRRTPEEAHQLYCDAARQHYGEFGRTD